MPCKARKARCEGKDGDVGLNGKMNVDNDRDGIAEKTFTDEIERSMMRLTICQMMQSVRFSKKTQRMAVSIRKKTNGSVLLVKTTVLCVRRPART